MKFILFLIFLVSSSIQAASGELSCGSIECDEFSADTTNLSSLQDGLTTYMNYCYGCHSLKYSRYNRISKDLNIPIDMYQENLIFDGSKPGQLMNISMNSKDAVEWIGAKPPDLTLEARIRKPNWIYTYLRKFYPDDSRPYGVNNEVYYNVSMPHVLEDLQANLSETQFNEMIYNLTNFMVYVSDPSANERKRIGVYVLLFLLLFTSFAYLTYREFKKDLK
jgi:cytochrome c1